MSFESTFKEYHQNNPQVFETFCYYARQLVQTNARRTSGWLIINRMRWESLLNGIQSEQYKLPNDYIGIYTRAFSLLFPYHKHLFVYKAAKRDLDGLAHWVAKKPYSRVE